MLAIVIYHFLYWMWKQQLVLLEDFGSRPIDCVLFVSALLLLFNNLWVNRALLVLNIFALLYNGYFDVIRNCMSDYSSRYLFDCGWFSWENIWLPWWIAYWCMQIIVVVFLLMQERKLYIKKRHLV